MKPRQWLSWMGGGRSTAETAGPVRQVRLADIRPNPFQPRQRFDESALAELAESIRQVGLLQPLLVRPAAQGGYELVAGERRWRAARQAGLEEVPVVVRELDDRDAALLALVENVQREDLGFFEEAAAYQEILSRFGLTQEQLAAILGRQQSTIANKLRLLRLPPRLREQIVAAGLSERHARALLRLESVEEQEAVLQEAIRRDLSVREMEELVAARLSGAARPAPRRRRLQGLRAIKDVRILLNTVRAGVETLRRAGLPASFEQAEQEEWIEVRIRIPKGAAGNRRVSGGGDPGPGS